MDHDKMHPSEFLEFATIHLSRPRNSQLPDGDAYRADGDGSHSKATYSSTEITNSSDELFSSLSKAIPGLHHLSADAKKATKAEHRMTFWKGIRLYPKAMAWSVLLSCTIIMEGYDTTLITSFLAFPIFRKSYGSPAPGHGYEVSPAWQAGLTNGATVGEILGLFFNGILTDKFGYHKTVIGSLIWLSIFVFLAFFSFNIQMLMAANILCGLSWGIFQTLSTTYAAEVMPVALRAYLTSTVNMCWLVGQLIGVGVIRILVHNNSRWSYRIPFGLQWAFATAILVGVLFAPESPWWLVRHGKLAEAKKVLLRLTERVQPDFNASETVAMMEHTNEVEKYLNPNTSFVDCFKGTDLRRTEIAAMVWVSQSVCGSALTGFAAYFFEQAGFDTEQSFNLAVGMYGLAIVGGILSWVWMRYLGRRTLYLWGLVGCLVVLLVTGTVACLPETDATSRAIGSLIILMTFIYDSTIGPVCYTLVAEIPSTRLRVKTVVLARVFYNVSSIFINIITPRMLNPTAWNWKGKSAFMYAGTTTLCLIWCYWRLPESKGEEKSHGLALSLMLCTNDHGRSHLLGTRCVVREESRSPTIQGGPSQSCHVGVLQHQ
jgi:SP family general alpha glucoside:H+ symporter-like MFS transporter